MAPILTDAARERCREELLKKGMAVANKLAEALAGLDVRLEHLDPLHGLTKPGMRPEERLRAYLDRIEARRKLLARDPEGFARCARCGEPLHAVVLQESPWMDVCMGCAAEAG